MRSLEEGAFLGRMRGRPVECCLMCGGLGACSLCVPSVFGGLSALVFAIGAAAGLRVVPLVGNELRAIRQADPQGTGSRVIVPILRIAKIRPRADGITHRASPQGCIGIPPTIHQQGGEQTVHFPARPLVCRFGGG